MRGGIELFRRRGAAPAAAPATTTAGKTNERARRPGQPHCTGVPARPWRRQSEWHRPGPRPGLPSALPAARGSVVASWGIIFSYTTHALVHAHRHTSSAFLEAIRGLARPGPPRRPLLVSRECHVGAHVDVEAAPGRVASGWERTVSSSCVYARPAAQRCSSSCVPRRMDLRAGPGRGAATRGHVDPPRSRCQLAAWFIGAGERGRMLRGTRAARGSRPRAA